MTDGRTSEPRSPREILQLDSDSFRILIDRAPTAIMVVRKDGTIALSNQAAANLVGFSTEELRGQPVEVLLPTSLQALHEEYRRAFTDQPEDRPMGQNRDLMVSRKDGSVIPVEIGLRPVETSDGMVVICTLVDLSYRKAMNEDLIRMTQDLERRNERLARLATTDGLTSLRNRQTFMDHLRTQLETSVRHARPLSVLILDIDDFKGYNDHYGHLAGDEVLKKLGTTLLDASRRSDLVARLGGEEFGIILPETNREGAVTFGERFRKAVESVEWPLRSVTVSVGATTVDFQGPVPRPDPPSIPQILREADRALYRSKHQGRNRLTHSADMQALPEDVG